MQLRRCIAPRRKRPFAIPLTAAIKVWAIAELRAQIIDSLVALERPRGYLHLVRKRRYGSRPLIASSGLQLVSRQISDEYQKSLWKYLRLHARGLVFMVPDLDCTEILDFFGTMPPGVWTAIKSRASKHWTNGGNGGLCFSVQLEFSGALSKLAGKEDEMELALASLRSWNIFERYYELNVSMYIPRGLRQRRWEEMRSMKALDPRGLGAQRLYAGPPFRTGAHAMEYIKCSLDIVGELNLVGFDWYQLTTSSKEQFPWQEFGWLAVRAVGSRQKTS
nr:hypothetical protein B0A51_03123 [Rachicladosporium sp. CCFEE 5018]